jgi:hypothetical protein
MLNDKLIAPAHTIIFPPIAVGANKVMLDIFNASALPLVLRSLRALADGRVAVTGVVAAWFSLTRTTAIGTGGTAANNESAVLTAPNIATLNARAGSIISGLTARAAPAGGAAAGAFLTQFQVFPEETNAAAYLQQQVLDAPVIVPVNSGLRVVQDAVASVGGVGFEFILTQD